MSYVKCLQTVKSNSNLTGKDFFVKLEGFFLGLNWDETNRWKWEVYRDMM